MKTFGCTTPVPVELLMALAADAEAPPAVPALPRPATAGQVPPRLKVAEWLRARGVEFRVKPEPDRYGRTVFVLARCPFNPDHGDPDACVMQAASGQMSAKCFHNSCGGRGWSHFRDAIGKPEADHYDGPPSRRRRTARPPESTPRSPGATPPTGGRAAPGPVPTETGGVSTSDLPPLTPYPDIYSNKRQLRDVTEDALAAVRAANDPPHVFQRGGVLTRIKVRADDAVAAAEPLTDDALKGVLARVANWFVTRDTQDGTVEESAPPPTVVVKDVATLPAWECVPILRQVVHCPVFAPDGHLIDTPGYSAAAQYWYQPTPGCAIPAVPDRPSPADIARARHLLVTELLGDFPFADDASRATAMAALLGPFVRGLIAGPTPLHLFDAPTEGTGKSLLASMVAYVSTGREVEAVAEAGDDAEWRKRVTAALAEAPTFVLLDNLNRTLDSGALAAALTARVWKDRLLGVSKMAALPVTCTWLATGNNTKLSRELIRRTLFCRVDSMRADPWLRTDFRHPNLARWARDHRRELVWAALTLVRAWVVAGRPPGRQALGMFEDWVEVVGGVLDVAEVPGLLANARAFRASRADQVQEWEAFVAAWSARYRDQSVSVRQLFQLVSEQALLDSVIGDKGERSQRTRLGLALGKAVDRVFGAHRVAAVGQDHSGCQTFRLEATAPPIPVQPTASPTEMAVEPDTLLEWQA